MEELTKLLQKIFDSGQIPKAWRIGVLVPVFKKSDRKILDNYQGILLLDIILKLTTEILSKRISDIITLSDEQQGFKSGRSCLDAIYVVHQVTEKLLEFNLWYMCMVDLEKAFGSALLQDVLQMLNESGIPKEIMDLIKSICEECNIVIRVNVWSIGPIKANKEIRQGDSSNSFLLIMDEILKAVKTCEKDTRWVKAR